jgi:hypothetical protein
MHKPDNGTVRAGGAQTRQWGRESRVNELNNGTLRAGVHKLDKGVVREGVHKLNKGVVRAGVHKIENGAVRAGVHKPRQPGRRRDYGHA